MSCLQNFVSSCFVSIIIHNNCNFYLIVTKHDIHISISEEKLHILSKYELIYPIEAEMLSIKILDHLKGVIST